MSTVIKIEDLSKLYKLGEVGTGTIAHDLNRWVSRIRGKEDPYTIIGSVNDRTQKAHKGEEIWALRDINLEIKEGDLLGIIGKNGAGKSTLLKILSRITTPTTGSYKIKGRMASLLEVGTGFHPEMTGRENIYMNGTIMGMRKREIDSKLDEIVEFAGVAKYLDTPVKRYSSGMTVRLGFSVAAHLNSEILVVDEVLAVGDAEFQKKAIGKMQDVSKGEGRTVLFVSHNMASIKTLCNKALWIDKGTVNSVGETAQIIEQYLRSSFDENLKSEIYFSLKENVLFQTQSIRVLGSNAQVKRYFECDEDIFIELKCISNKPIPGMYGWFHLMSSEGLITIVSDTFDFSPNYFDSLSTGEHLFTLKIPNRTIGVGKYFITFAFTSSQNESGYYIEELKDVCSFELFDNRTKRGNSRPGFLSTLIDWKNSE